MLKLKGKLEFRGHVCFQAIRPEVVLNALNWLKVNDPFQFIIISVKILVILAEILQHHSKMTMFQMKTIQFWMVI